MHLAQILGGEIADPRLSNLVITAVTLSADLGLADVKVRTITSQQTPNVREQEAVVRALTSAAGRLRHLLGGRVNLKRNPTLRFHYDTAPEVRERIDELLDEIAKEDRERDPTND